MHINFLLFPTFPNSTVIHLFICCLLLFLITQAREHGQHRNSSAACSGAQFFNFLGQDCFRGSASQPRAVASCHGSGSVVRLAGPMQSSNGQGFCRRHLLYSSHQAPTDKGTLHILEVYVYTKYGQVFIKTAKPVFLWK